jgi:hypothetical protein
MRQRSGALGCPTSHLIVRETGSELLDAGQSPLARGAGRLGPSLPLRARLLRRQIGGRTTAGAASRFWRRVAPTEAAARDLLLSRWRTLGPSRARNGRLVQQERVQALDPPSGKRLVMFTLMSRDRLLIGFRIEFWVSPRGSPPGLRARPGAWPGVLHRSALAPALSAAARRSRTCAGLAPRRRPRSGSPRPPPTGPAAYPG